jgi:F-type H+-transporting ATPase subunit delta
LSSKNTTARPYAKAAFAIANASNNISAWSNLLQNAAWVIAQPKVELFLQNPRITSEQSYEWMADVCSPVLMAEGKNFLKLLADNKRLLILPEIADLFEHYRVEQEKIINVEITSALPLEKTETAEIAKALNKKLQREINLDCKVDKDLIGGIIIRADDQVIDSSIRGKLNRLHTALVEG